jgi:predicted Rossmann fold flavoprotein
VRERIAPDAREVADVIVVGGGPAGMMAAYQATHCGARVLLLEKMHRLGLKLGISGKGRCNVTNWSDLAELVAGMPGNGTFLYSAFAAFSPADLVAFLEEAGIATEIERGGRVFPASGRALDVVRALESRVAAAGVRVERRAPVRSITGAGDAGPWTVGTMDGVTRCGRAVILATGGASYPATGSTGDGYALAATLGHRIVTPRPSLVPLDCAEDFVARLAGLSLRNVRVSLRGRNGRASGSTLLGELLFTHTGVSGPTVLSLSRRIATGELPVPAILAIDLKPGLEAERLDARILRDFGAGTRRLFRNALGELLPRSLIPVVVERSGIAPDKPVHQVTREERERLVRLFKEFTLTVTGTRSMEEAIVTAGGVDVREVDPRTMESRVAPGLFLAGEVLDVDGYTGGYNLQAAFSTGWLAGRSAAKATVGTRAPGPGA